MEIGAEFDLYVKILAQNNNNNKKKHSMYTNVGKAFQDFASYGLLEVSSQRHYLIETTLEGLE